MYFLLSLIVSLCTIGVSILIKLKNIEFSYRHNYVFKNFNATIPEKNIVCILGHNGAGKTTFLKLIVGSLLPKKGSVINTYEGKKIFLLSEKGNLYEDMSLRENIKFLYLLKGHSISQFEINKSLDYYTEKLFLGKHMDKKVSELSLGLKTRATILVGLIFNPNLFLLDEPTNNIDPLSKKILIETIKMIASEDKRVIIVTHDLEFCYEISETNIILNEGVIVHEDNVSKEDTTLSEFKEKYLKYTEEVELNESDIL